MRELDVMSNNNNWELELICKDKKYLQKVITIILEIGNLEFTVECQEDVIIDIDNNIDGHYSILINGYWFSTLNKLTENLDIIESEISN